jgi:XTP/dITP diphosphohydrolase
VKFRRRFNFVEESSIAMKKDLSEMTLAEMDALWNEAKAKGL